MSVTKDLRADREGHVVVDFSSPDAAHLRAEKIQCVIDDEKVVLRPASSPEDARERPAAGGGESSLDAFNWWLNNLDTLRDQYAGQWVAIGDGKVIAVADSPTELQTQCEGRSSEILIDFVPEGEEIETK